MFNAISPCRWVVKYQVTGVKIRNLDATIRQNISVPDIDVDWTIAGLVHNRQGVYVNTLIDNFCQ